MATSMKLLLRPYTVLGTTARSRSQLLGHVHGQAKAAFFHISRSQTVLRVRTLESSVWAPTSKITPWKRDCRRGLSSTRATTPHHVNDPGSIDSSLMQSMENKIKDQLSAEYVAVKDAYGDGRHVSIDVVSSSFEGQSAVNRQRMVYKAIWEELQSTVHAVDQMITRTPSEAAVDK